MSERRRPTFDEVLVAARQGAPWAVGWLYRRFQPRLLRMLAVIAPHHAADIAAEVWLELAGNWPSSRATSGPSGPGWPAPPGTR